MEMGDYTRYLSVDNHKGILLNRDDAFVLDKYGIDYRKYSSLKDLILLIGDFLDQNFEEILEDLEEVLVHLNEMYYYYKVRK